MRGSVSNNAHSSGSTGSRLMARRTGSGSGFSVLVGGGAGARRPRADVTTAYRRVRAAPHTTQVRPPWLTPSHNRQRHTLMSTVPR